ncbi:MAG TPA: M20/M25/M40 family metallo-hydrolase [Thermoanaerobaculia bacterium]|nr:M20/M25/M40 family metallo-hydrolase [Thermoanaerobaculia bacterium]
MMQRRSGQRIVAAVALLILASAVIALRIYNARATRTLERAYVPKKERITPEIRLLQQYVRIDTSNPPGNELEGARWLASLLEKNGIPYEIIEAAPRRANLYARIKGKSSNSGLLLLNHIDVVPARREEWSLPPFAADIRLNLLHGRGTLDMKGIAVCQLLAFMDVARSGRTPEHDIVFLATADEERGSAFGTRWLIQNRPDVFAGVRYALSEGGVTEMQLEELRYIGIEIGGKQVTTVDVAAPTRETLQRLRIALEPHFIPADADRVLPGVAAYFAAIAPLRVENKDLFADVHRTISSGKFWLLPVNYRALLQNSLWAGGVRQEGSEYRMRVSFFNLPDEVPQRRIDWVEQLARKEGARVIIMQKEGPVPLSSFETPLFSLLRRQVMQTYPGAAVGPYVLTTSTNDCRFLRQKGIHCYGFQPFPVDYFQSFSIHGVDERVRLDWFTSGAELMRRVVRTYAEAGS